MNIYNVTIPNKPMTNEFDTLREEYERNDYKNALVDALNAVSDEERDLIIIFIVNKCKTAKTARFLCQPKNKVYEKLMQARQNVIRHYRDILNQNEETDYLIDYYTKKHTKPKRPVIQANLFQWEPIARFDSIEEAANTVNGKPERIMSVCNGKTKSAYGYGWRYAS